MALDRVIAQSALKWDSVAQYTVRYLQFLNENSEIVQPSSVVDYTTNQLLHFYRKMNLVRQFDYKAINLQRTGQLGTFPSSCGQEAIYVGMGCAMQPEDVFVCYYRDQATLIERGVKLSEILQFWGGDERGSHYTAPGVQQDFPICVPIASQFLHAAGVAYAIKYREEHRAVLTTCGDGGTSKGDFYEALNLAGAWQLPIVFVINNNEWAISVSRQQQTAASTLAQKAIAAGFDGYQVDGNDVMAVHYAVSHALKKARNGGGPTLIEALSYRLSDHTTADDATRYVPHEEMKAAWKKEPIRRLAYYLESQSAWSKEKEQALKSELADEINAAVEVYLSCPPAKPTDIFDYMYHVMPASLKKQRKMVEE